TPIPRTPPGAQQESFCRKDTRNGPEGRQQSGFALLGLALGPNIATQLLNVVPSWRWVFWIVALPGFVAEAAADKGRRPYLPDQPVHRLGPRAQIARQKGAV